MDLHGVYDCPFCQEANGSGVVCGKCGDKSFLKKHVAIARYDETCILADVIRAYKYEFVEDCFCVLARIMEDFFASKAADRRFLDFAQSIDCIVPIPLHPRRFAERGFNQSERIGEVLARLTQRPFVLALARRRFTLPQARLRQEERKINITGAFVPAKVGSASGAIAGKKILLVDDVFTTGATMQECARVLLSAGAKEVCGFSMARG